MKHATLLRFGSLLAFFLLWQLVAWIADSTLLPPPSAVLLRLWRYCLSGALPFHLGVTLLRVVASFAIAMLIGIAIGMVMGCSRRSGLVLDGLLVLGLNIPALVTIILCYIWFGLTEVAAITAVAVNKIPTVVVMVREGARAVDGRLLAVGQAYRLPRTRILTRIYLPQLYPYLMGAARSGLALIWKIVLVVELL